MTPGTVVGGKYLLVRLLGQGAMGEVWAAVNESTGGEVALKLLSRPREELRHRLLREARACGKLRHRNVIDVHDVGETDEGDPFLVMALLSGETLADLLDRQRRLDPAQAVLIARDIARALAAAHKAGIVHRDLKPANVFLHHEEGAEDVIVKVLDFGVSKDLDHSDGLMTIAGATVGSPAYMSPEQARSARDLDHRTDLWSLGVVLFEMLTGKRPFEGDAHQVLAKIALGPIPLVTQCVRHVDPALGALVARCLERDPARRFGSAEELAAALDRFARPASSPFPEPMEDDDGVMPTMRWNRAALRAMLASAPVSPPGADASGPVDVAAPTLPDVVEASPLARTVPLDAYPNGVPRAPTFGAPPLARIDAEGARDAHHRATLRLSPEEAPPARSSVLSSMAPVVQPQHDAASLPPRSRRHVQLAAAIAIGCVMLALFGAMAIRALRPRRPVAAEPPRVENVMPPAPIAPPVTAPEPITAPTEQAAPPPPPPAKIDLPRAPQKPLAPPSRRYEPTPPNGAFGRQPQKPVKAAPRGI